MADETLRGTKGFEHVNQGGRGPHESEQGQGKLKTGISTAKIGHFVTRKGAVEPFYELAVTTDGSNWEYLADIALLEEVLRLDPDWNIDTALPDALIQIRTYRKGSGAVVPVNLQALAGPIAIIKGDALALASEGGKVRKWLYTDAVDATDTQSEVIGYAEEGSAGDTSDDLVILARLA